MKKVFQIVCWILLIFSINEFGRYLYVEFLKGGYNWLKHFYIVVAGSIATFVAIILFFSVNYIVVKKRKEQHRFSFNTTRLLIMILSILIAFLGERLYLYVSDYLLLNS